MKFVWNESLKQAREMLQSWICSKEPGIPSIAKDTQTLSLNVLAATGFHRSYKFCSSSQRGNDESRSYRDALQTVLDNAIPLMLVSRRLPAFSLLPRSWARIGEAAGEFKQYMMDMLDEEKSLQNRHRQLNDSICAGLEYTTGRGSYQKPQWSDSKGSYSRRNLWQYLCDQFCWS